MIGYSFVDALNAAGIPAAIWHGTDGFRASWFNNETRIVWGSKRQLSIGDILLVPELGGSRYQSLMGAARVVMLNQNHFYTVDPGFSGSAIPNEYPGWPNAVACVATSEAIREFVCCLSPGLPVLHVPVFVHERFFSGYSVPKRRQVAFAFDKAKEDVELVILLLNRLLPPGWNTMLISGMSAEKAASLVSESAIFVSSASRDGFSLPGAEAMAAGCRVIGYDGGGAAEYLREPFAVVTPQQHLVALARAVVAEAADFDNDPQGFASRVEVGRQFVMQKYSREIFNARAISAYHQLEELGAGQTAEVVVRHYSTHNRDRQRSLRERLTSKGELLTRGSRGVREALPVIVKASGDAGVSIVIPHYGDPNLALQVVDDIARLNTERAVEIIVVDDKSPVEFPETPGVTVIRRGVNGGFGSAVNDGVRLATKPWLMIANSDLRIHPDFLDAFVQQASDLQPCICSPHVVENSGRLTSTGNHFPSLRQPAANLAFLGSRVQRRELDDLLGMDTACTVGTTRKTDWLIGACLLLPTNLFRAVGGFDERFHMFCEEIDLQWRLADMGVAAWYLGDHMVQHEGGSSSETFERAKRVNESAWLLARKRGYSRGLAVAETAVAVANIVWHMGRRALLGRGHPRSSFAREVAWLKESSRARRRSVHLERARSGT